MLFPKLTFETVLQVEEKTRLDAGLSFVTDDEAITDILIEPANAVGFISVYSAGDTDKWHLDWAYDVDGMQDVSVKVVATSGDKTKIYSAGINVLSVEDDALLSSDNDLIPFEPDILNYLPNGKNSFIYVHRKAQERIISYLDEQRIWHNDGSRYTKQDLVDVTDPEFKDQFRQWSSFETLLIIFESLQVSVDDIFQEKKVGYEKLRNSARSRGALQLDANQDGTIDEFKSDIISVRIKRR